MMRELDLNQAIRKKPDKDKSVQWWDDLGYGPSLQTQLPTESSAREGFLSLVTAWRTVGVRHIQTHGPRS